MKKDLSILWFPFNVLLIIICITPSELHADDARYKNMLIGERAATMSGSYVTVSEDSTGCY